MDEAELTIFQKIKSIILPISFNIILPIWDVFSDARLIILLLFVGGHRCMDRGYSYRRQYDTCRENPNTYCTTSNIPRLCEEVTHPLFGLMMLVPFLLNYLLSIYTWNRLENNKRFTFIFPLLNLYAPYGKRFC